MMQVQVTSIQEAKEEAEAAKHLASEAKSAADEMMGSLKKLEQAVVTKDDAKKWIQEEVEARICLSNRASLSNIAGAAAAPDPPSGPLMQRAPPNTLPPGLGRGGRRWQHPHYSFNALRPVAEPLGAGEPACAPPIAREAVPALTVPTLPAFAGMTGVAGATFTGESCTANAAVAGESCSAAAATDEVSCNGGGRPAAARWRARAHTRTGVLAPPPIGMTLHARTRRSGAGGGWPRPAAAAAGAPQG